MYNAQQIADKFNLHNKVVRNRAIKLGFIKKGRDWNFTEEQAKMINDYTKPPIFRSAYYFSNDGEFLILNSRMNQYLSQINKLNNQ